MEIISERSRVQRTSYAYGNLTESIVHSLQQYSLRVSACRSRLSAISAGLTSGEALRRRQLVDALAAKDKQLRDSFSNPATRGRGGAGGKEETQRRQQLFGGPALPPTSLMPGGDGGGDDEPESATGISTAGLKRQQAEILAEQDRGLDSLHDAIVRQKRIAETIHGEVDGQNALLDDIGDGTDDLHARLITTTEGVRNVTKKDRTCGYWLVIFLLIVVIVIIVAVPPPRHK